MIHTPVPLLIGTVALAATSVASRFVVWLPLRHQSMWLPWLQTLAIGLLVGDSLLHILADALRQPAPVDDVLVAVTGGVAFLTSVEAVARGCWGRASSVPAMARLSLTGDFIHHLIDGVILAGAFMAGPTAGCAAVLAVGIHEVPREMGSAGVLVDAGFTPRRAFGWSVAMATGVPLGGLVIVASAPSERIGALASGFAAGAILYVALADILPPVWQRLGVSGRVLPMAGAGAGLLLMWWLTQLELR